MKESEKFILCIETATTVCSVCIASEARVISIREINSGYTHAENLNVFIEEVLKEAGISFKQLSAVAVSKGPGSYTGLRIGVSAAKGFCYALNIPLISIDTLEAMAFDVANKKHEDVYYSPLLDARRMEVYCAVYDKELKNVLPVNALVLDENSINVFNLNKPLVFFGDGMPKAKELLQHKFPSAGFVNEVIPSSKNIAALAFKKYAQKQFENTALFEPFYLKEFFTKKPA